MPDATNSTPPTGEVAVVGAGTMGAGIAQVAAAAGWTVHLFDVDDATVEAAIGGVGTRFDRLAEKKRITPDEAAAATSRLGVGDQIGLARCDLLIEAIVESLEIKTAVLRDMLPSMQPGAIVATNTSSLSVTDIGRRIGVPERTCGMHFFNPAALMRLVEVIAGRETRTAVIDRVASIAESWGKTVARAADVPGFIVNHVARPYYLEAFRILEDGYAGPEEIDGAMRDMGGFRMGPLELTDLIGQDVNTATTRSVWAQLDEPPLLAPSRLQEQLVADGHLGRKTGRGVYTYDDARARGAAAVEIERRAPQIGTALQEAIDEFVARGTEAEGDALQRYVFARILAAVMVQASHARRRGVAGRADIDVALKHGTNYPLGPFEWVERIGGDHVTTLLEALEAQLGKTGRFRLAAAKPASAAAPR